MLWDTLGKEVQIAHRIALTGLQRRVVGDSLLAL
jgi:hypothetical protein